MIGHPERSEDRDSAIDALLAHVPFDGWTVTALRHALAEVGQHPDDAALLFPGGAADMVAAFCDLADRRMAEDMSSLDVADMRLPDRVRAVIAARLGRHRAHREAVRRAVAVLALPQNATAAAACTARTVDAIWHAAGDQSADFSWYTKRAILAAVYGATLLFWLRDTGEDDAATLAFLDRRLADIHRIGGLRRTAESLAARFIPASLWAHFRPAPSGAP